MISKLLRTIKLNRREEAGVLMASAFVMGFVLFQFVLSPALAERQRLNRVLRQKADTFKEMRHLQSEYESIRQQTDRLKERYADRPKGFTLFSFLDKLARETGIKDHIAYMKPSSSVQKDSSVKISAVELKIQEVALSQLTRYLYGIETSTYQISIQRASFVRKGKEEGTMDVVLQVQVIDI